MYFMLANSLLLALGTVVSATELTHTAHCDLYFTDGDFNVLHAYKNQKLTCDSSYVHCDLPLDSENTLNAVCNSKLQWFPFASFTIDNYFCVCHGHKLHVPSDVYCDTRCYPNLKKKFNHCNWMEFYDSGFKDTLDNEAVLCDSCNKWHCDEEGKRCATNDGSVWLCDNTEYDVPFTVGKSYVCNCHGPAKIPEIYRHLTLGRPGGVGCKKKIGSCK